MSGCSAKLWDVLGVDILQKFQESFFKLTGFQILFVDNDYLPLMGSTDFTFFCPAIIRKKDMSLSGFCMKCGKIADEKHFEILERQWDEDKPIYLECSTGFLNGVIPIVISGKLLGYCLTAQIFTFHPNMKYIRGEAKVLKLDPDERARLVEKIKVVPREILERICDCLHTILDIIFGIGWQKMELEISKNLFLSIQEELQKAVTAIPEKINSLHHGLGESDKDEGSLHEEFEKLSLEFKALRERVKFYCSSVAALSGIDEDSEEDMKEINTSISTSIQYVRNTCDILKSQFSASLSEDGILYIDEILRKMDELDKENKKAFQIT
ncbi:MAG: PocR ligand-binding domain-containing protein [Firmicutes bacterium]|nr:PocR ligand-binding domain-containing protein [Bacillota bacterium]